MNDNSHVFGGLFCPDGLYLPSNDSKLRILALGPYQFGVMSKDADSTVPDVEEIELVKIAEEEANSAFMALNSICTAIHRMKNQLDRVAHLTDNKVECDHELEVQSQRLQKVVQRLDAILESVANDSCDGST